MLAAILGCAAASAAAKRPNRPGPGDMLKKKMCDVITIAVRGKLSSDASEKKELREAIGVYDLASGVSVSGQPYFEKALRKSMNYLYCTCIENG
jgi:hypothetical protein